MSVFVISSFFKCLRITQFATGQSLTNFSVIYYTFKVCDIAKDQSLHIIIINDLALARRFAERLTSLSEELDRPQETRHLC